jgi:hypothetical protein
MGGKMFGFAVKHTEDRPWAERGFFEVAPSQTYANAPDWDMRNQEISEDGTDPLQDIYGPRDLAKDAQPDGKVKN